MNYEFAAFGILIIYVLGAHIFYFLRSETFANDYVAWLTFKDLFGLRLWRHHFRKLLVIFAPIVGLLGLLAVQNLYSMVSN